jgi:hypothetical protein
MSLVDDLRAALNAASDTPRGQRAINGHDEDFELEVGKELIHLGIRGGKMTVNPGASPRHEPLHFSRLQMDEATLRDIIDGRISPVEAMEEGRLFLRTRLYGGALATILLRSAYDLARERTLAKAS